MPRSGESDPKLSNAEVRCAQINPSYDFDPGRSCLTFRMPSPLHDMFCAKLVDEISNQLRNFQQGHGPAATFAKKIVHFATSRILIPDDADDGERNYIRREPDASFGHSGAHYPGVIIEVCYSQKRREVSRLADDYILNTDGSVNVVVCLDIDYKQPNKATISVWRPKYVEVDGVVEFRTSPVIDAQVSSSPSQNVCDWLLIGSKGFPNRGGTPRCDNCAATIP